MESLINQSLGRIRNIIETLRQSYWFLPLLMAMIAVLFALGILEIEDFRADIWSERYAWFRESTPEGARALLSTIAGSMITVTGVVFSITIVALTLTSSQFGPRLLRAFMRDRGNQIVLGTFISTFLYSLIVLESIGDSNIPFLRTASAVALAVLSIIVLIYFLHHATTSIQASNVIAAVSAEIRDQMNVLFPEQMGQSKQEVDTSEHEDQIKQLTKTGAKLYSEDEGYIRILNTKALFDFACSQDLLIEIKRRPGDFVPKEAVLALIYPKEKVDESILTKLHAEFVFGDQRAAVQDISFLIEQLSEMAVRALSPGVNDPRTAIACVNRLGAIAASLGRRQMPAATRYDEDGNLRIVAPPTTFADLIATCFDSIRRYGKGDADVVVALLMALREAADCCAYPSRLDTLSEHAYEVYNSFKSQPNLSARDMAIVEDAFSLTMAVLTD